MRLLAYLPIEVCREREWVEFALKVLPGVPSMTIMEMNLRELQSFTVNFN